MKKFRGSTFAAASLSALAFTFGGLGSASAWGAHGSSGGSHGGHHGSHGGGLFNHGSHGSSGGSHGGGLFNHGSHGSNGGSHGGGLFNHGSHGSNGGSHGGHHGSHGGGLFNHGSHGSSGGSWGSNGGSYAEPYATPQGGYASPQGGAATPQAAYLNVTVPEDAKVYLQDQLMTLNGTQRRFVTPELSDGGQHVYTVKVEVERNGQTVSKTTQATIAAGQEVQVSVAFDAQNPKDLVASVTPSAGR